MRAFLALNLDGDLRERLHRDTAVLRAAAPQAGWVRAANLHLTLRFLGEVAGAQVEGLAERLRPLLTYHHIIDTTLVRIGAFPNLRRPRVIWVGVHDDRAVGALAKDVDRACGQAGFAMETRPFSAHVTLGRVKHPLSRDAVAALTHAARAITTAYPVRFSRVDLMQSELASGGSRYAVVVSLPLGAA